jgi:hypothetical protein
MVTIRHSREVIFLTVVGDAGIAPTRLDGLEYSGTGG